MPRALEVSMYEGTADPFCTILPDHTGHYWYPSNTTGIEDLYIRHAVTP